MKRMLFLAGFLLAVVSLNAQSIKGTILSTKGEALGGISVTLEGTHLGTMTNAEGYFRIGHVPPAVYTLTVSGVGYKATKRDIRVEPGKAVVLDLQLDETTHSLSEVTVKAAFRARYSNTNTSLATRTEAPLLEVPQSIQSVPQQVIRDQQALTLNDLTKNLAGVTNYAPYSYYILRGFSTNYDMSNFTTNGVRGSFYDFSQQPPLYNVESVDAIKGPASALFSASAPGGIINITTKQPQENARYELNASYGSWNQYRVMADATGPLDKDKKFLYRFIAGNANANSFRDYVKGQNIFLAPSLTWRPSDKTSLTGEINYQYDNTNIAYDRGIVALPKPDGSYDLNTVPISWSRHNPSDTGRRINFSAQLSFTHRFNSHISFTSLNRYAWYKLTDNQYDSYGAAPSAGDSIVDMTFEFYPVKYQSFNTNNFLTVETATGAIRHSIVVGFDYGIYSNPFQYIVYGAAPISVLHPNPAQYAVDRTNIEYSQDVRDNNRVAGAYLQDQVDLLPKLKALLGLRYDNFRFDLHSAIPVGGSDNHYITKAAAWLPRFGLVYEPLKQIALYVSYCQSYNPNYNNYAAGGDWAPEKGTQYEGGVKTQWMEGKLMMSVAIYTIDKTNVLEADPNDPAGLRQIIAGAARSKGVELNVQGSITPELSVMANYAYDDARITKDDVTHANVGNWLPDAPQNLANLWLKYNFPGVMKGLGLGAGVQYVGKRAVMVPNAGFFIPDFTSYQAAVNYRIGRLNLQFNVYNIGNTRNYTGGYGPGILWTEPGRNIRAGIGYTF